MILGKVIGTVWGAKQSRNLSGRRVVEVRPVRLKGLCPGSRLGNDPDDEQLGPGSLLAVDPLGADTGQTVLVSIGSRVRDLVAGPDVPTKHCVVAIVDEASVDTE
ncbi:MAG: EutN/CcmL family microcompartment protein [Deltaproteobacteria bacterium]|nr:EutN/CcmL family microcompartment protein [Deltaproteobacteria bacterium]